MKIAYYIGSLNRGGAEMLTLDICRQRLSAPYEIILVYRNDGDLSEEFRQTGVTMYRLKPKCWHFLRYIYQMRKLFIREHVNVVHSQTIMNGVAAVFFLIGTKIKLVTSFHGFFNGLMAMICRHIVMWGSDATIYVSNYVRDWYVQNSIVSSEKCHTVYNGICFDKFDKKYNIPDFIKEIKENCLTLNIGSGKRICIAMVGNFVIGRSQNVVVKGIDLLHQRGFEDFDFFFVGKRNDNEPWRYDECVKFCKENNLVNVHFVGSRGDVPAILQNIDAFVYSTECDTFGIALVEAMAVNLPIVVNDWPVMKEVCGQNSKSITYFCSEDIEDCANKIEKLINQLKDNNIQLKEECLLQAKLVREKYSIENHINQLYNIYSLVL